MTGDDALAIPAFGGRPAIAVLPFDNLSSDPDQAFFADGLAEDLITRLSTWVTIVIRFASKAAARAWYDSPEYQKIVGLRTYNSEGVVVFADEFVMPR